LNCKNIIYRFNKCLKNIVERHNDVVQNMALGIVQMRENYGIDSKSEQNIQYFLDRFLMSRISIRMLINQHRMILCFFFFFFVYIYLSNYICFCLQVLLFTEEESKDTAQIGAIDLKCNVLHVLQDAYTNAKFLCDQYYLASPEGEFEVKNTIEKSDKVEVVYVPSHLYHMAFELYKNAMRAVIEHCGEAATTFPSLKTLIVKGNEDIRYLNCCF
jgi:pyruvate dehydrogenase kinase 2/3/4